MSYTLPAALAGARVCRGSCHAVAAGQPGADTLAAFSAALDAARAAGRILTASLYRYENQLFFYVEGLDAPFTPEGLCPALDAQLIPWPPALGGTTPRPWAAMQPYFLPRSAHHRRGLAAEPPPGHAPGPHCAAAAGQMVQLYGAPPAPYQRGAAGGRPLAFDQRARKSAVFVSRGTTHQRQSARRFRRGKAPSWPRGWRQTPKATSPASRPSSRPTRMPTTTLFFCPALPGPQRNRRNTR